MTVMRADDTSVAASVLPAERTRSAAQLWLRRAVFLLFLATVSVPEPAKSEPEAPPSPAIPSVEIRFFFQPGCDECVTLTNEVLPLAASQFGDLITVVYLPVDVPSNRLAMLDAIARENDTANARVYVDVNRRHLIAGAEAIGRDLSTAVNIALAEPSPSHAAPAPDIARTIASRFTVVGVIVAGLVDSVNPCAVAALIFLVSVLTLAREKPVSIAAAGISYCAGVFVTYTAIGFGLLNAFRAIEALPRLRMAFHVFLCLTLAVLAALSFRDAARARAGEAGNMTLRLPDAMSAFVRSVLRSRFGPAMGLVSAFLAGCLVTAIETVCTGQVYGPTLAIIVAQGGTAWRETALLMLYNLMFILPLLAILLLAWKGTSLTRLIAWSTKNAAVAKVLMGVFFLGLLAFLVLLRIYK